MMPPSFRFHRPGTVEAAISLLAEHGDNALPIAGGTDLIAKLRAGSVAVEHLVSVNRISGLDRIEYDPDAQSFFIGARARISAVGDHPEVQRSLPGLAHACSVMATVQIRNMGTVVGNVTNGSPCADTAAPLLTHDASVVLRSVSGLRRVPLAEFFLGPSRVDRKPTELVERLEIPLPSALAGSAYLRLSARSRVDMAAVSVAARVQLDDGGKIAAARLAIGAVAPTTLRCRDAETELVGSHGDDAAISAAAEGCMATAKPIDDVRATAEYRRAMVGVLAQRVIRASLERAQGGTA